jgi:hypothetical protein
MNTTAYTIYFDRQINAVIMKWTGYATSLQFREGTELMLDTMIANRCDKVLASIRDMVLIATEDQEWLTNLFVPRAARFGFKKIAIVTPSSYFNRVAVQNVIDRIGNLNMASGFFDHDDEAKCWLTAPEKTPDHDKIVDSK